MVIDHEILDPMILEVFLGPVSLKDVGTVPE